MRTRKEWVDDSSNEEAYGEGVLATDILIKESVRANEAVKPFVEALRRHAPIRPMECMYFRPFERMVRLTAADSEGNTSTSEQLVTFFSPI